MTWLGIVLRLAGMATPPGQDSLHNVLETTPRRGNTLRINVLIRNTQQQSLNGLIYPAGLDKILRPRDCLPDPRTKTGPGQDHS